MSVFCEIVHVERKGAVIACMGLWSEKGEPSVTRS